MLINYRPAHGCKLGYRASPGQAMCSQRAGSVEDIGRDRRRSSVNFGGGRHFCLKIYVYVYEILTMPEFYIILS